MDMVKSSFDMCLEVEPNVKADGTLTVLCRYCCTHNLIHKYDIYGDCYDYDIISFSYQDEEYPGLMHILHWLEEKSAKNEKNMELDEDS